MDVSVNEVVFESLDNSPKPTLEIPSEISEERRELLVQLLQSGYYDRTRFCLCMNRFLDEDRTINLEKFELAISLIIEWLEFSIKSKSPIKVILGGMSEYFIGRRINLLDMDRVAEETSFILGFAKAIADEYKINKKVMVQYDTQRY